MAEAQPDHRDRRAVYDIGSNSIKFLAAERDGANPPKVLVEESRATRLAENLIATCELKAEAVERTLRVLAELKARADSLGVSRARAVATSAVRDSRNRKQFLKAAQEALGCPVELLSGDEEAETIYRGIRSDAAFGGRDLLGIDVGGGSAEWILGAGGKIGRRMSLPLGCVRLRERFVPGYPFPPSGQEGLLEALREQLAPALKDYLPEGREIVATGGSITAAAALDLGLTRIEPEKIHRHPLTRRRIEALIAELGARDLPALEALPGLPPGRADIVLPGLAVFAASLRLLGADALTVSVRGLRYGVLDQLFSAS